MAWRLRRAKQGVRPEKCPACGHPDLVVAVMGKADVPSWTCKSCGHRVYDVAHADLHVIYKRLVSRNQTSQSAQIAALTEMGQAELRIIHALQSSLRFRSSSEIACLEALVAIGGREASEEVDRILIRHLRWARWGPLIMFAGLGLLLLPLYSLVHLFEVWMGLHPVREWWMLALQNAAMQAGIAVYTSRKARRRALEIAKLLSAPMLCGVLGGFRGERRTNDLTTEPLRRLLPLVSERDADEWDGRRKASLIRLLGDPDGQIILGALHAVSLFGGDEAVEPIERLLRDGPPWMRPEIEDALAAVRKRIQEQKDRDTLLRASTPNDGSPETLLRPAAALPGSAPEQLLRHSPDQSG